MQRSESCQCFTMNDACSAASLPASLPASQPASQPACRRCRRRRRRRHQGVWACMRMQVVLLLLLLLLLDLGARRGAAWPYAREIPALPASWRSSNLSALSTAYFVGNDTGMDSLQELAAEAQWGIIGIGWQLNASIDPETRHHVFGQHVEVAERQTAAALKAQNPGVKVLLGRNSEVGERSLDSVAAVWDRDDFWLKCGNPQQDCVKGWGSFGVKKFFDFSSPAMQEWCA